MTAPLGVRTCPVLGCHRRIHVTDSGTVWARCLAHGLEILHVFSPDLPCGPQQGARRAIPSLAASSALPMAVPAHRPAA